MLYKRARYESIVESKNEAIVDATYRIWGVDLQNKTFFNPNILKKIENVEISTKSTRNEQKPSWPVKKSFNLRRFYQEVYILKLSRTKP